MNADLPHLGAGYPVLRSKICQGGGYDAVIRTATEPEASPRPYSTSQGANQDIRAPKMSYLTNQEGLNHEATFFMDSTLKKESMPIRIGPNYSRRIKL